MSERLCTCSAQLQPHRRIPKVCPTGWEPIPSVDAQRGAGRPLSELQLLHAYGVDDKRVRGVLG